MESTHFKHEIFVVADDLGLDEAVNEGIFFALKNDLISGASLMVGGEAFDDVVRRLKDFPSTNIGIHIVLVEGRSLTGIKLSKNHKTFFIKYSLGLIKKDEIKKESEAQIQKCLSAGIRPQFINSHQHLHLLPGIMDIVISLAKKYEIPYIRIVNEPLNIKGSLFRKAQLCFLRFLSGMAKNKILRNGLKSNDLFIGFINAGSLNKKDLQKARELKDKYPDKFIELGCHPGFESPALVQKYRHWHYNWRQEIEILKRLL